jgi:F0F1-type ATP synthase delta subunit
MKTSISQLAKIISEQTKGGSLPKNYDLEIAAYLLDEGRTGDLSSLLRSVQEDWAEAGLVEANVYSAFKLSSKTLKDIEIEVKKIYPRSKKIRLIEILDPKLIGGVRVSTANNQMDLSISTKLSKFKQLTALTI